MNHEVVAALVQRVVVTLLIEVNEVVGINGLQLSLCGVADVHLVVVLHIGPLCLAVEPYGGHRRGGIELTTLYGYLSAGVAMTTSHLEVSPNTFLGRNISGRLVEHTLCGLPVSSDAQQHRCYQKTNLFHYPYSFNFDISYRARSRST